MKILLIEDDLMVRKALGHQLLEEGHNVTVAVDGEDAFRHIEDGMVPDLVICDVMLPVLTGPTFILKLRLKMDRVPAIILISGDRVGEDYIRKLEIPYDVYLSKPIDPDRLRDEIGRIATRQRLAG